MNELRDLTFAGVTVSDQAAAMLAERIRRDAMTEPERDADDAAADAVWALQHACLQVGCAAESIGNGLCAEHHYQYRGAACADCGALTMLADDETRCHECETAAAAPRPCFNCHDTGRTSIGPCRYCTHGDALVPAAVIGQPSRCMRSAWGYCIRHQVTALDADTLAPVRVSYGTAQDFSSCPARTVASPARYGFITPDETTDGRRYLKFVEIVESGQAHAKQNYRASIQS
jgi:hypothetical protein